MPETLSVHDVAHQAAHRHGESSGVGHREELIELVEAPLLAIVAIATAWSGYQAARRDGKQAELYGIDSGAAAHGARAEAAFEDGTHAREQGERYVRDTILLATVLFLTALAQRFKVRALRLGLIGVSPALLVIALYFVGTYPRA